MNPASANSGPGGVPVPPAALGATHHLAGGSLPYTGADLWLYVAAGLLLILAGLLFRGYGRLNDDRRTT